jgi:16S rRNA processing protein RimM
VHVTFTTNRPERAEPGSTLYAGAQVLRIRSSRPHKGRYLVRFEGIEDRDDAETLRGVLLTADPLTRDSDELWVDELVGARVVDRSGRTLGTVQAVEANPAHDLLVLDSMTLVPVVFVVERRDGELVVDVPDGLVELG